MDLHQNQAGGRNRGKGGALLGAEASRRVEPRAGGQVRAGAERPPQDAEETGHHQRRPGNDREPSEPDPGRADPRPHRAGGDQAGALRNGDRPGGAGGGTKEPPDPRLEDVEPVQEPCLEQDPVRGGSVAGPGSGKQQKEQEEEAVRERDSVSVSVGSCFAVRPDRIRSDTAQNNNNNNDPLGTKRIHPRTDRCFRSVRILVL
mmetsp:Transcript_28407/g.60871  ORF Transcript_28407/g.60871 Transcript_28407/m.60871 type:complete len:203 (-) Transcript_28407:142-750(-)